MAKFFKTFAKGILYILALPLLLVFLVIYFVISLISFIFLSIQGIILFFKGESIVGELEEDRLAKQRLDALAGANNTEVNPAYQQPTQPTPQYQQQPTPQYQQPVQAQNEPLYEPEPENELSLQMNVIDENNIESEDEVFVPLEEPLPNSFNQHEEEIVVQNNSFNEHEFSIEEEYTPKESSGGVDFSDYEGRE